MTESQEKLSPEAMLKIFNSLIRGGQWKLHIENRSLIRVRNTTNDRLYCPLSAAYFKLSDGKEIGSCFTMPELTRDYGMFESDIVEFAHAIDACDVGRHYDPDLRIDILKALGASKKVIEENTRKFPRSF